MGNLFTKPETRFWRFFHNLFLRSKVSSVPPTQIRGLEPILRKDPMTHVRSLAYRAICYTPFFLLSSGNLFRDSLSRKKITKNLIDMMMGWRHSGFNVHCCGPRIQPGDGQAMENLAHYIIRTSFSQERMTYIPEESKVICQSKDGKKEEALNQGTPYLFFDIVSLHVYFSCMAKIARVVDPGFTRYITQRGNRRQETFFNDADYQAYIDLMSEWCCLLNVEVWAYCLMLKHIHLIAVPEPEDGLPVAIGEAHRRYTRRINFREGWRGHLWQGRFASYVIDDNYVLDVFAISR